MTDEGEYISDEYVVPELAYYVRHGDDGLPQIGYVYINPGHGYEIRTLDGEVHISIGWKILGLVPDYPCWKLAESDWNLQRKCISRLGKNLEEKEKVTEKILEQLHSTTHELDDLKKRISDKLEARKKMVVTLQELGGQPTNLAEFKARMDELQDLLDGR